MRIAEMDAVDARKLTVAAHTTPVPADVIEAWRDERNAIIRTELEQIEPLMKSREDLIASARRCNGSASTA